MPEKSSRTQELRVHGVGGSHGPRMLGYDSPHDHREGVSEQELMPDEALGERFLELSEHGEERELRERFERIRRSRGR